MIFSENHFKHTTKLYLGASLAVTMFLYVILIVLAIFGAVLGKKSEIVPFLLFSPFAFFHYLVAGLYAVANDLHHLSTWSLILIAPLGAFGYCNLIYYRRLKEMDESGDIPDLAEVENHGNVLSVNVSKKDVFSPVNGV